MEQMEDTTPLLHGIAAAAAAAAVLVDLPQPAAAAASGQWWSLGDVQLCARHDDADIVTLWAVCCCV